MHHPLMLVAASRMLNTEAFVTFALVNQSSYSVSPIAYEGDYGHSTVPTITVDALVKAFIKFNQKPTCYRWTYYFASYRLAQAYAQAHDYPTDRIIAYMRGYAIQGGVSGDYAGPHGLKVGDWPNAVLKPLK